MGFFDRIQKAFLTYEPLSRSHNDDRRPVDRGHGTLGDAFYAAALGGINTYTIDNELAPNQRTSNARDRIIYQLFGGDSAAQAYYLTFLASLPEEYIAVIKARLTEEVNNTSPEQRLTEFWEPEIEKNARESGGRLRTIQAGARSLAGFAGLKAKIKFQRAEPGGITPWHLILFFFESKYNPIKWGEYWANRAELALKILFQKGLNRKKAGLDMSNSVRKEIHLKQGGVIRNQLYFLFLMGLRSIAFAIGAIFNSRLHHFAKTHPYLFGITFLLALAILMTCVFFPPAAAIFLAFSPKLIALLAGASPAMLFVWAVFAIYVASAIAKITSQIFETSLNLALDIWTIITDKNSFIRKHPILSISVFIVVAIILLLSIFFPPLVALLFPHVIIVFLGKMSPLVASIFGIMALNLAAMISCKFCHIVDVVKQKWEDRNNEPVAKINLHAEADRLQQMKARRERAEQQIEEENKARREQEKEAKEKEVIIELQDISPTNNNNNNNNNNEDISIDPVPESNSNLNPQPAPANLQNTDRAAIAQEFGIHDERIKALIKDLEESNDDDDNFTPSFDTLKAKLSATVAVAQNTISRRSRLPVDENNNAQNTENENPGRNRAFTFRGALDDVATRLRMIGFGGGVSSAATNNNNNNNRVVEMDTITRENRSITVSVNAYLENLAAIVNSTSNNNIAAAASTSTSSTGSPITNARRLSNASNNDPDNNKNNHDNHNNNNFEYK